MAYLVDENHFQSVSDYLEKHLPDSFIVYKVLQRIKDGPNPGYQVWSSTALDSSSYNVIVISADPKMCKNPFYRPMVHLFCTDPADIDKTLSSPCVINFSDKDIIVYGVLDRDLPYIQALDILKPYEVYRSACAYQYICHDIVYNTDQACLDGLKVSTISSDILDTVAKEHWGKGLEGVEVAHQDWMNWEFPTICLYNEDNIPVAWERVSFWGDVGSLFVIESYRGKGIGKYVVASFVKQIIEKEGYVISYIEDFNSVSEKAHEAVGFKKNEKLTINWALYSRRQ